MICLLKKKKLKVITILKNFFKTAIFLDESQIKEYSINRALELNSNDQFFLEFGVFQGKSINFFAKKIKNKTIYGFDSFSGLNEDWEGTQYQKGYFDLKGKTPKVEKNVILIKGKVQETLENFLDEHNPRISSCTLILIHMIVQNLYFQRLRKICLKMQSFYLMNCIISLDGM